MKKIILLNEKGGVGKSTIAFHLAGALAKNHGTTALIDTDTQQTASNYAMYAGRNLEALHEYYQEDLEEWESGGRTWEKPIEPPQKVPFDYLSTPVARSIADLEAAGAGRDFIVVDTPGGINRALLRSIMDSDALVLIPSDTKNSELWTTAALINRFTEDKNPAKATIRIVKRQGQQRRANADYQLGMHGLTPYVLKSSVSNLNAFDEATDRGGTVCDVQLNPHDRVMIKARNEINSLANEIVAILGSPNSTSGAAHVEAAG